MKLTELEKYVSIYFMVCKKLNFLFIGLGWFFFTLGIIGVFLPLFPTVPFMILAAACFSKGSEKWHLWLLRQKKIGPAIRLWEEQRIIPRKAKWMATFLISVSPLFPFFIIKLRGLPLVALVATLSAVVFWIWRQKDEYSGT